MMSSRKSSKLVAVPSYTDWEAHPASGRYYRYYTDETGQEQLEWSDPRTTGTVEPNFSNEEYTDDGTSGYMLAASQEIAYQHDAGEEDLTAALGSLNVEETEEAETLQQDRDVASTAGSSSKGKTSGKQPSKSKKDDKSSSNRKGKGKGKGKEKEPPQDEPPGPFYDPGEQQQAQQQQQHRHQNQHRAQRQRRAHGHQAAPTGVPGGAGPDGSQPVDAGYGTASSGPMDPETPYYPAGTHRGGTYRTEQGLEDQIEVLDETIDLGIPTDAGYGTGLAPQEEDDNDEDIQRAIAASRGGFVSSARHDAYPPGYGQAEPSYAQGADYEPVQDEDNGGDVTPTKDNPSPQPDMVIRGTQGSFEALDTRYRVEPSKKFQPGEVFKILWSEPLGQQSNKVNIDTYTEKMHLENDWGEPFYVGFRRFIVVANDEGHCACVPILTYIRQGCKKRGVKASKHGIIHEYNTRPRLLEGEPALGFAPVGMEIRASGERLARESRVNYSKIVTVEHNVKVYFIGNIYYKDFNKVVQAAVNQCWTEKTHQRAGKQLADLRN